MIALALLVAALLALPDQGWVATANLAIWIVFASDYFLRLALSTDGTSLARPSDAVWWQC